MEANELIARLKNGALRAYASIYTDVAEQTERYINAISEFTKLYGEERDIYLFSVPGRSEISGNHTDHNHGRVLAGAIDRDIIAVASPEAGVIRIKSEGYDEDIIAPSDCGDPDAMSNGCSASLIAGTVGGFAARKYATGGFCAYTTSRVLKGSGLSSSAAFEVMVGSILNHFYNGGRIANEELAKIAQYAENVYFGKPCGLMDQMACAVGGFVAIDFNDPANPVIEPLEFSLTNAGYVLCIVNTGGNHADLTPDYTAVSAEMKAVAAYFGKEVLRGISFSQLLENLPILRTVTNDRAVLRAIHFVLENERVEAQTAALRAGDLPAFLDGVIASGNSSYKYLQNVYTVKNPEEQGLSLALAISESLLACKDCAWRVHGGGFAGTVQVFVKRELAEEFVRVMDSVFGEGAAMCLSVRPLGAVALIL